MSDEKTPKPRIDVAEDPTDEVEEQGGEPSPLADDAPATASTASRVSAWVAHAFPGHEGAFWGGLCGLLVALLVFAIGLGRTLLIAVLVLVGAALGQAATGDPRMVNAAKAFFKSMNRS